MITYFQINENNTIVKEAGYPSEDRVPSVVSEADDWYLCTDPNLNLSLKKYYPDENRFADRTQEEIEGDIE